MVISLGSIFLAGDHIILIEKLKLNRWDKLIFGPFTAYIHRKKLELNELVLIHVHNYISKQEILM